MQEVSRREGQASDRDARDPRSAPPTLSSYRPHPHPQGTARAFDELPAGEGLVQHSQRSVDQCFEDAVGDAPPTNPPNLSLGTAGGTPNEDAQVFGGQEMQGPAHAPSLDQGPFPEGGLHIFDPQVADPGPERDLRRREHLRLSAGHFTDDRYERPRGCPLQEMVPGEPKGGYLAPSHSSRGAMRRLRPNRVGDRVLHSLGPTAK